MQLFHLNICFTITEILMNAKTLLICTLTALLTTACGNSENSAKNHQATKELNIYNWSDYVDPATTEAFQKKTGIEITEAYYDSNEVLEAKMLAGQSGFDLVAPSIANMGRQIKAGVYQELDKSQIPNYHQIDPELLKLMQDVDPNNKYAVPYFWGINTLAINTDLVKKALGNEPLPKNEWDLVFKPEYTHKLKSCGISFFDSPTEQYPLVLHYLGKNPNSEKPEDLQAATDLMKSVRSDIKRFSSSGYIDDLAKGDLCVAIGYGGDLNIAKRRAKEANNQVNIDVLTPQSGVGIWIDSFAIPKQAKNTANALKYINYTLDPQVAAQNGNFVTYAPASQGARALMKKEYAENSSIFPTEELKKQSFVVLPKSVEGIKLQTKLWQTLKAGQ